MLFGSLSARARAAHCRPVPNHTCLRHVATGQAKVDMRVASNSRPVVAECARHTSGVGLRETLKAQHPRLIKACGEGELGKLEIATNL